MDRCIVPTWWEGSCAACRAAVSFRDGPGLTRGLLALPFCHGTQTVTAAGCSFLLSLSPPQTLHVSPSPVACTVPGRLALAARGKLGRPVTSPVARSRLHQLWWWTPRCSALQTRGAKPCPLSCALGPVQLRVFCAGRGVVRGQWAATRTPPGRPGLREERTEPEAVWVEFGLGLEAGRWHGWALVTWHCRITSDSWAASWEISVSCNGWYLGAGMQSVRQIRRPSEKTEDRLWGSPQGDLSDTDAHAQGRRGWGHSVGLEPWGPLRATPSPPLLRAHPEGGDGCVSLEQHSGLRPGRPSALKDKQL